MEDLQKQITEILNDTNKKISEIIQTHFSESVEDKSLKIQHHFSECAEDKSFKILSSVMTNHEFFEFRDICKDTIINHTDENGHLNIIEYCNDKGDIIFLLEVSCELGLFSIVKYIVESGIDINKSFALYNSAYKGHLEIVKYLVEHGANINETSALTYSAKYGHLEVVKYLVNNGANIDCSYALYESSLNGHLEVVKYLVDKGADMNTQYALPNSAKNGHLEVVKYLVEIDKNTNIPVFSLCRSLSLFNKNRALLESARNGHLDVVKYLIKQDADIKNSNALYESALNCHFEVVKYLAKKYKEKNIAIPNNAITKNFTDINRVLFMYTTPEQNDLFNPEIIATLGLAKSLMQ